MQSKLLAAMLSASPNAAPQMPNNSALARAMLGRMQRVDPRYKSLAALPPYGEARHADGLNGAGSEDVPAFQPDAFQNDAFQVS